MTETAGRREGTRDSDARFAEAGLRKLFRRLASATEIRDLSEKAVIGARDAMASAGAYIERVISRDEGVEIIAVAGERTPPLGTRAKFPGSLPDGLTDGVRLVFPLRAGNERLGSLVLLRSTDSTPFLEPDVDRGATVADAIAIAMQRVTTLEHERELRGQLTRTLESIVDGFVSVDRHLRVLFLNRAARDALEIDPRSGPTDLAGRPLSELMSRSAFQDVETHVRRAIDEQTALHFEQRIGANRWFSVSVHPSPGQLSIFFRDVTDAKLAELALRRNERRQTILADTGQLLEATLGFQSTLDRLAHLLVRWLCDWCAIYLPVTGGATPAVVAARDPEAEALVRCAVGELDPAWSDTATMRALRTGRPVLLSEIPARMIEAAADRSADLARLMREHRPRSAMIVPLVARGHTIAAMALVSTSEARSFGDDDLSLVEEIARRAALGLNSARLYEDATRRALAESALRKAAASVTAKLSVDHVIQEIARNALVALDAVSAFVERVDEQAGAAVVVATAGELVPPRGASTPYEGSAAHHVIEHGQPERIRDLGTPGRLVPKVLTTQCRGCPGLVVPLLREQAAGALFFIRAAGTAEFGDEEVERGAIFGELAGLAFRKAYLFELAERRRADAEAAARARDEVLAVVSHDLRSPLHTIGMAASILDDDTVALRPADRREQCGIIKRSTERMNRLIGDLLDVSRIEAGRFTVKRDCQNPITIADEAFATFRPIAESRRLHLRKEIPESARPVSVDRDRIMQVLSNILDNAVKCSSAGSEIVLGLRSEHGRGIRFSVRDQGPGIAPDALPHIFDRFWQGGAGAHTGAGLGLAIAAGIAKAHDGRVWVESVVGAGSTFHLELPYVPDCP